MVDILVTKPPKTTRYDKYHKLYTVKIGGLVVLLSSILYVALLIVVIVTVAS